MKLRFYLHSLLTLTSLLCPKHARGKVDNILLPYMQKSREAMADARKRFKRES